MTEKEKKLYKILSLTAVGLIIVIIIAWAITNGVKNANKNDIPLPDMPDTLDNHTIITDSSGILTSTVAAIDTTVVEDELKDMGVLITEEYFFTEVVNFSSTKKLFNIEIGITESSYIASYDGYVEAGIDFSKIWVSSDEEAKTIRISLPKASVQSVVIDPDSFTLYSEKDGFANRISASDFNGSLVELNKTAEEKAIKKGVLERADENAEKLIRNFIGSIADTDGYTLVFSKQ